MPQKRIPKFLASFMLGHQAQRFQVFPFEFARRREQIGSRSEVDGFRVEFGHG